MKYTKRLSDQNYKEIFEQMAYGSEKVTLETSDINDPDIQRIIKLYADTNNIPMKDAVQHVQDEIDQQIAYLSKAKEVNKNAIDNAPASAAFQLMEKIDLESIDWKTIGIEEDDLLDGDVFFDLTEALIKENPTFFPLRNPFENKSIKPFFYIAPDDLFRMNDAALEQYSQGDFTAFCTPTAQIVFNRKFSERMCLYSLLSDKKPKSKKYVSNGGNIPDHYEFIEFIIAHELLHYTAGDHFYTKKMVKKIIEKHPGVTQGLAHKILNYVGDYINNWTLLKSGYSQLPIGLFSEDLNYDKMETYEDVIEAVVEQFSQMTEQDLDNMTDALDKQMDDHQESEDQAPSQGGGDNQPADQGDGGEGQDGQGAGDDSGEGEQGDESGEGQSGGSGSGSGESGEDIPQSGEKESGTGQGSGSGGDSSDAEPGEGSGGSEESDDEDMASKIDDAMKEAEEKMKNRDDGNTTNNTTDILNGKQGGSGVNSANDAQNKGVGDGSAKVDTSYTSKPVNWKKVLKKMVPAPTVEMEDCYQKMSRDSISSAVGAVSTGSSRIKPGECPDDQDKKGLCIIIDNSGSVSSVLNGFNQQIIKLLINKKTKAMLENFYVIKFSDGFTTFKIDVEKGTFQEVKQVKDIFKKDGKQIDMKPKLKGPELPVKTKLFERTFAAGTYYTDELHFVVNALHKVNFNMILFTDDDLAYGGDNEKNLKKFYALGNKKKGSCAIFFTDQNSYNKMGQKFGSPRWTSVLQ